MELLKMKMQYCCLQCTVIFVGVVLKDSLGGTMIIQSRL